MTARLEGKVALVTGGGSGIGRGITAALADEGCAVAIGGRRREVLEATATEIASGGRRVVATPGNVADRAQAERMVASAVEALGDLHIVVNNAGIAAIGPLDSYSEQQVDDLIDIDLKGPIFVTQAALPHLRRHREQGGASVINISSSVTHMALKDYSVYSAAKAGLEMLTRCLALELAGDRIRVNAIAPGVVETGIFATMMPAEEATARLAGMSQFVPLGRIGQPADIARLALFLASPENDWTTGAVIPIDGGLSLGPL